MVNKERIRLWEQALRNPKLIQGQGRLAARDTPDDPWRQCCLDVACQVAIREGLELEVSIQSIGLYALESGEKRGYRDGYLSVFNFGNLTPAVQEWYGLDSASVMLRHAGQGVSAAVLNDAYELPFPEIADVICETFQLNES
jgi:hypothetical protein